MSFKLIQAYREGNNLTEWLRRLVDSLSVECWHEITAQGSGGWVDFQNSWVNYDAGYNTAAFYKSGDRVHLKGLIKLGSLNQNAFTLPIGYRPATGRELHVSISNNAVGRVDVLESGGVLIDTICSSDWVSLDGISFRI